MKYIITEAAFKTAKNVITAITSKWASMTENERNAHAVKAIEACQTAASGKTYVGGLKVPMVAWECDHTGATVDHIAPPTLIGALRLGIHNLYDEDGRALVVQAERSDDPILTDYNDDNESGRAAAGALQKGFNPAKTPKAEWEAYQAPIREIWKEISTLRKEVKELRGDAARKAHDRIKELELERASLNCMNLEKFIANCEKWGNTPPLCHDGTEEGKIRGCMALRVRDFNALREDPARKEAWNADRVAMAIARSERSSQEEADLKLSVDSNIRQGRENRIKKEEEAGMSLRDFFQKKFASHFNSILATRGWGEVLRLDETNSDNANCTGWGKLVRSCYLPAVQAEQERILATPSMWKDYILTRKGKPATIYSLFGSTLYLLEEGMPMSAYCACCGVTPQEVYAYRDWVAAKEKAAKEKEAARAGSASRMLARLQQKADTGNNGVHDTPF